MYQSVISRACRGARDQSPRFLKALVFFLLHGLVLGAGPASAQVRTRVGHISVGSRVIPLWIAQEQGFFAKYGIELQAIVFRGTPTLASSLIGGEIESGYIGGPPVVTIAAQGVEVKLLASFNNRLHRSALRLLWDEIELVRPLGIFSLYLGIPAPIACGLVGMVIGYVTIGSLKFFEIRRL